MLRNLSATRGHPIKAGDDRVGGSHDFLFDGQLRMTRHLVADTGRWLPGREVLVSPAASLGVIAGVAPTGPSGSDF
jgi:hypothetical protein